MTIVNLLSPQTAAGDSNEFTCDGYSTLTVGMYTSSGSLNERVGASVMIKNPTTNFDNLRDRGSRRNRVVTLTQEKPEYPIKQLGTFRISKPATTQAVGFWCDTGA